MKALISGQAATAVVFSGDGLYSVNLEYPEQTTYRNEKEVPMLLADATDIKQIEFSTQAEILNELQIEWEKDRSLQLTLILLDPNEEEENRLLAAECLDEFFIKQILINFVSSRLYSAPLPKVSDIESAIRICSESSLERAKNFLATLAEDQEEISTRRAAWDALPISLFGDSIHKDEFFVEAVRYEAFKLFATERGKKNFAIVQLLTHPQFRGNNVARNVFRQWAKPFEESATKIEFEATENYSSTFDDLEKDVQSSRRSLRPREAFENAEKQREAIKNLLNKGNTELAARYTQELIKSQRLSSDPEHIAKSLCDLAQHAKNLGSPELQLQFAELAVSEAPSDAWSFAVLGDAYRALTDYQKAVDAYHTAGVLGNINVSMLGRAEILKDLGNAKDALPIFEQCVHDFPDDLVSKNSYASALADFGKLHDSLKAYDLILNEYPYELVTRNGRAQVQRDLGDLEGALEQYNYIIRDFPVDRISKHARAEILRELGRLDESKEEFDSLIEEFSLAPEMRSSYARVLRDLGLYDEAINQYENSINNFPYHKFAYTGLADTYRKIGALTKALELYNKAISLFPKSSFARNGKSYTLVALDRYIDALAPLPSNLPATINEWVSYHIRGMIYMRSGKLQNAERIFLHGVNENPWKIQRLYFQTALASIRIQQKRYEDSIELVQNIKHPVLEPVAKILNMHALGELDNVPELKQVYQTINKMSAPIIINLRDFIFQRYAIQSRPTNSILDKQIFFQECNSLLLAA